MLTQTEREKLISLQKEADQDAQEAQRQIAKLQAQLKQTQADREKLVYLKKEADQEAHAAEQQHANLQAQLKAIAPDTDHVHIDFSYTNNEFSIGLFDTQPGGQPAWAIRRHPNSKIAWTVPQDVTINSIKAKSGSDPLPIDVDPNAPGGQPGVPFKAKVKHDAGDPGDPSTKTYYYLIDVTYKAGTPSEIRLMIDPEMIINKP